SSGTVRLKREWVALDELIGAVLHRHREGLAGRAVTVDLPPELPLVECDEVMIGQVLGNIVENAQKHTPPGTPLRIAAAREDGDVAVRIADAGPGLPAGDETRVFDKFHRGREEAAQSGFGLGLAICKAIVEAHGGRIAARNLPQGGAEFTFTLPLTPPPEAPP